MARLSMLFLVGVPGPICDRSTVNNQALGFVKPQYTAHEKCQIQT